MKLFRNQAEKVGKEFWSLDQNKLARFFFYLLILFLPTQLGKHFFPNFSFVYGLPIDYLSPTLYLTDVLIILIIILSLLKTLKIILEIYLRQFFFFLLFCLFLMVGIAVSKNPLAGIIGLLKLLEFIYLGIYVYLNINGFNKKIIAYFLAGTIIFEFLLSIAQYFNQGSFQGLFYFLGERRFNGQTPGIANASINGSLILRPYGTFSHPNVLAGFFEIGIILLTIFKKNINKYFIFFVISLGTAGIIISFSRSAAVAWIIFVISFFGLSISEKYKKTKLNPRVFKYRNYFLALIVFVAFMFFANSIFGQRFTSLKLSDESVIARENLTNQSIQMISKNTIFGTGINNFINNLNPSFNTPLLLQPVHNIFLLAFAQSGIVGIGLLLLIFYKAVLSSIKPNINIYKLGLIFSIIFIGMLDHYFLTIQQGQILFTLTLAYVLSKQI